MKLKTLVGVAVMAAGFGLVVSAEEPKAEGKKAPPTPEEKAKLFEKKDTNTDGKLSKEEFLAKVKEENKAKMEAAFTKIKDSRDRFEQALNDYRADEAV